MFEVVRGGEECNVQRPYIQKKRLGGGRRGGGEGCAAAALELWRGVAEGRGGRMMPHGEEEKKEEVGQGLREYDIEVRGEGCGDGGVGNSSLNSKKLE